MSAFLKALSDLSDSSAALLRRMFETYMFIYLDMHHKYARASRLDKLYTYSNISNI